jgi:hypothetical protein
LLLFVGGTAVAVRRVTGRWLLARVIVTPVAAVVVMAWPGPPPAVTLAIAAAGASVVAAMEHGSDRLPSPAGAGRSEGT